MFLSSMSEPPLQSIQICVEICGNACSTLLLNCIWLHELRRTKRPQQEYEYRYEPRFLCRETPTIGRRGRECGSGGDAGKWHRACSVNHRSESKATGRC